jgi:hypothetical protein
MSKFIVTTTINSPTKATNLFNKFKDWTLIVVGDLKTPEKKYSHFKDIIYLTPRDQNKIDKKLSDLIGWNCIQRRNLGYVLAYKLGAKFIATVDDDNIPNKEWGKLFIEKKTKIKEYSTNLECFDPLSIFKFKNKIWHRGFPLQLLKDKPKFKIKPKFINADVQANLWDVNPDIDAINRLSLSVENYKFKNNFFYSSNKISPFNSQNTILTREALKKYFLFPFVGRMDDIWGSYYLQSLGYNVVYGPSTVAQERNPHNIYNDFKGELIGYNNNLQLIRDLKKNPNSIKKYLPKRSILAFKRYMEILK